MFWKAVYKLGKDVWLADLKATLYAAVAHLVAHLTCNQ